MDDMEQTDTNATDSSGRRERSTELVRPLEGRMLAGVAQGIADNFAISVWIPRVFFIVTAFMGGLGLALYAAGWAFIRAEDESESPADRFFSGASGSRSWLGIGLIVVAGIIVLSNFTFFAGEVVWALTFLVVGLLLYLGYIPTGRQRGDIEASAESKEGVQRMTTTETLEQDTTEAPTGDSPAGGSTTPPPGSIPEPPSRPPAKRREPSLLGRLTIGVMLLALGVLAALDNVEALPIDADPRHYTALAVTVVGVGLLVGAIAGRARWLILVALVMLPTLMFTPVFENDWRRANFDRRVIPTSFQGLQHSYQVDIGTLVIDLRSLPWDGEEVTLDASVDAGSLEIVIPSDVGIVGSAEVDVGRVSEPGRTSSGLGSPGLSWDSPGVAGTVILDAEVNVGNIDIRR